MNDVVLWMGPVATDMIRPYVPAQWRIVTNNHGANGGIGSAAFAQWARTLGPDPLTRLAGPSARRIVLAGFSAAHGAFDVILGRAADMHDQRLVGLFAADAYYSAWNVSTPKLGYEAWLRIALERGLPAWLTVSTHHPASHPSASESIKPLVTALGLRQTEPPSILSDDRLVVGEQIPEPKAFGRGSVQVLDYGASFKHAEHATRLAPVALQGGPFLKAAYAGSASYAPQSQNIAVGPASPTPGPMPAPPSPSSGSEAGGAGGIIVAGLVVLGFGWLVARANS